MIVLAMVGQSILLPTSCLLRSCLSIACNCWAPDKPWLREKDPIAIHENNTKVQRWIDGIFPAIDSVLFPDNTKKVAYLAGVRAEESPSRVLAISTSLTYKHITWAKSLNGKNKTHITFYPIYDWSYTDIWKAIHDNGWVYNPIYDLMFQYGTPVQQMRVSNLHHETSVKSLFYLQEFDAKLYNKMTEIYNGVDSSSKAGNDDFFITELPFMFDSWKEYGDHLLENLVTDNELKKSLLSQWKMAEKKCLGNKKMLDLSARTWVKAIVVGDINGTKMDNLRNTKLRFYEREELQRRANEQIAEGKIGS
jgi:predicted phosphoadenosine phosphosulfate sulfurtransferase